MASRLISQRGTCCQEKKSGCNMNFEGHGGLKQGTIYHFAKCAIKTGVRTYKPPVRSPMLTA